MVGTATGVKSGVATTPGTLINCDGAPGRIGTEGSVRGGGPGGGAGACARATPARAPSKSANIIAELLRGRARERDVEKILTTKKNSICCRKGLFPARRAREATERAAMIRKPGTRCKSVAFGKNCPVPASLDAPRLRNAPTPVASLG
jgi:hypothetical protein